MEPSDRSRRYTAALLLGFAGACVIALGQRGTQFDPLVPGSRRRPAQEIRPGSIRATTLLSLGGAGADWGSDSLRDAVAGAPAEKPASKPARKVRSKGGAMIDPVTGKVIGRQEESELPAQDPPSSPHPANPAP